MFIKRPIILLIILAVICGVAVALLILIDNAERIEYTETVEKNSAVELAQVEPSLPANQSGIVIPEEVYSYQGEVIEKGGGFLKIKISALDNYIETDQEIEARFDEQTAMTQIVISPQVEMRSISAAEIEIGQTITVTTRENIKGRTSFRAESIRIVSQKQF